MFHFNNYWRTWSRVLTTNFDGVCHIVEVNLTPIHNCGSSTWDGDVKPILFRAHCTPFDKRDKLVEELPLEARAEMVVNIGDDLTHRLMTEDFLSQIDHNKLRSVGRGSFAQLERRR